MEHENMTGAELQTLREACNLGRDELGDLVGVQARTVKHWESGRAGVPADVAKLVRELEGTLDAAAAHAIETVHRMQLENGAPAQDVVLLRYKTDEDLATHYTDQRKTSPAGVMPASLHGAIVGRVRLALRNHQKFAGAGVRVVWFDADDYRKWLPEQHPLHQADSSENRAAWAAQQVEAQAMPHRGDQPPKSN